MSNTPKAAAASSHIPTTADESPERLATRVVLWIVIPTAMACAIAFALAHGEWAGIDAVQRTKAFWRLFSEEEPTAGLLTLALLAAGALWSGRRRTRLSAAVERLGRQPWPLIATFFLAAALAARFVYRAYPLSMDEYAPWFQARAFAAGKLAGQVPADFLPRLVPTFQGWFIEVARDGRMISGYWPGFALLLAPLMALGVPWLLNPLIGAASLVLLWDIARRLLPPPASGWVILLTLASPAFFVNAISFYSMSAHLLFSLLFVAVLIRPSSASRAALAGAVGSFALVLHNPLPHTLFALPWIVWVALRPRERHLVALLLGYLPLSLLLGIGWVAMRAVVQTDAPGTAHAVHVSSLAANLLGLAFAVPSPDLVWAKLAGLVKLLLWAAPGLLPLAWMGAVTAVRDADPRREPLRLIALSAALTLAGFLFVPFDQGHGWGYRYFHSAWGTLPLLAAFSLLQEPVHFVRIRDAVVLASLASLVLGTGLRLAQVRGYIDQHLAQIPPSPASRKQVVFVRGGRGSYAVDMVQNDPFLRGSRLMLFSKGDAADAELARNLWPEAKMAARSDVATVWLVE